MSPEPVTAERVYARLKDEILHARFPPRTTLISQAIAEEYGTSISPVRDSQQRLVGEGLLEAHAGGGFQVPDITTEGLRDLYDWHGQLIAMAIRQRAGEPGLPLFRPLLEAAPTLSRIAGVTADLFALIARQATNAEVGTAILSAGQRLQPARLCEADLIPNLAGELESIRAILADGSHSASRAAIKAYHRRRLRRVDALHAMLHNPERFQIR